MADYALPTVVEKRVRYFDGQYLQDQDFIDEQDYQLDREHRHNRLLHGPGIADGLTVTSTAPNQVNVAPGTAVDSDGYQLVLAQVTTVDLPPADFNDKTGVQLYISYQQSAEDPQTVAGSADFTRWLERPQLTTLAPGQTYSGTAPPVLLATLALDSAGRVAVDSTVRSYSGLRLPGSGADAAILHATSTGPVELAGSLTVDGSVGIGIGTIQPASSLHVNVASSATPVRALQIDVQSFQTGANATASQFLLVRDVGAGPSGNYFFIRGDGNIGIGTVTPGAKLEVAGHGGTSIDLLVNGRLQSNNNDGGLWVAQDRFVGGHDTNQIGFYNGNAFQLTVLNNGNVGIGTTNPENAENWAKVVDVLSTGTAKLSVRTPGIDARFMAHDSGWWGSLPGMVIGTRTNHALGLGTSAITRMTITNAGNIGVGATNPENSEGWNKVVDILGSGNAKLSVRTANIDARVQAHDGGFWGSQPGMVIGTKTNHALIFGTSAATRMTITNAGNVGIAAISPGNDLEIGAFDDKDRYLAFKVGGGNQHISGIKMWAWQDNYGYSVQYDERNVIANGLHLKTHNQDATGTTRLFVGWGGNIGVGTTQPSASLHVNVAKSSSPIQGLQVDVESFTTMANAQASYFLAVRDVGAGPSGTTHFCVRGDGTVGIGTTDTSNQKLCVAGPTWLKAGLWVSGPLVYQDGPNSWKVIYTRESVGVNWAGAGDAGGPNTSDVRLKTDLRPISHALDLVRRLQGVRYRWGDSGLRYFTRDIENSVLAGPDATDEQNHEVRQAERRKALDALAGDRLGLVAQDVETVIPELVHEDGGGYKHIRYQHLTALLTEAIKEQDALVQALSAKVAALQAGPSSRTV